MCVWVCLLLTAVVVACSLRRSSACCRSALPGGLVPGLLILVGGCFSAAWTWVCRCWWWLLVVAGVLCLRSGGLLCFGGWFVVFWKEWLVWFDIGQFRGFPWLFGFSWGWYNMLCCCWGWLRCFVSVV